MALLVRRLKVEDLPRLETLAADEVRRFPARAGFLPHYRKLMEKALTDEPGGILVAEYDGRVVGGAIVKLAGLHPVSGLKHGVLSALVIAQGWRAQGVGHRLLLEAEAYCKARGAEVITATLPADAGDDGEIFKDSGFKVCAWELERPLK